MLKSGDVIGGRYRLVEPLATGGMGAVWRAEHTELNVDMAVKVMLLDTASTPTGEERFRREAQAAARLKSPHVVQVHDFGIFEGQPYLAMELLHGEDLDTRLEQRGALPLEACATILDGVAKAIQLAHEHGIIHRDLKPGNIYLAREGEEEVVKVLDFGIAKMSDAAGAAAVKTGSGLIGSPAYMSPEQVWCEPLTNSSDLWSLAVVAFEMVTGKNPFQDGPLAKVFDRIIRDDLPRLRGVRPDLPELDAFFQRALMREPALRFASATELAKAFREAIFPASKGTAARASVVHTSVAAKTSASVRRVDPHAHTLGPDASLAAPGRGKGRWLAIAIGVGALLLGGVTLLSTARSASEKTPEVPAESASPASVSATAVAATANSAQDPEPGPSGQAALVPSSVLDPRPSVSAKVTARGTAPTVRPATSSGPSVKTSTASAQPSVDPLFGIPQPRGSR